MIHFFCCRCSNSCGDELGFSDKTNIRQTLQVVNTMAHPFNHRVGVWQNRILYESSTRCQWIPLCRKKLVDVYGDHSVSTDWRWLMRFCIVDRDVNDKQGFEWPCIAVKRRNENCLIGTNLHITTKELCTELNVLIKEKKQRKKERKENNNTIR